MEPNEVKLLWKFLLHIVNILTFIVSKTKNVSDMERNYFDKKQAELEKEI